MLVIIQARMSSQRLAGKVLKDLAGEPMLAWTIKRLRSASTVSRIVVATSTDRSDDCVADFCARHGVGCHRGSLENVAERFVTAATAERAGAFVRICGDSPLIDPAIVDTAIRLFQAHPCDLVTNVMTRTFPKGQSVEVIRTSTFARVSAKGGTCDEREHVTGGYYSEPAEYQIVTFSSGVDAGRIQLSVDTVSDLNAIERLIVDSARNPGGWRELMAMTLERTA